MIVRAFLRRMRRLSREPPIPLSAHQAHVAPRPSLERVLPIPRPYETVCLTSTPTDSLPLVYNLQSAFQTWIFRSRPNETTQSRVRVNLLFFCHIFSSVIATAISQLPERNARALRSESVQLGLYPPHGRYSNARRREATYGHLDSQRRTTRAHSDDAHTLRRGGADQPCR